MILFADTNILLDLNKIHLLREFLSLNNEVCIEESMFEDELLEPKHIQQILLQYGLQCISMTNEEFVLAQKVYAENPKLSFYDSVAFAVAKCRNWILLTGDKRLRNYAEQHQVEVHGLLYPVEECVKNGINIGVLWKALDIIETDPKIRVPDNEVTKLKFKLMNMPKDSRVFLVQGIGQEDPIYVECCNLDDRRFAIQIQRIILYSKMLFAK